MTTGPGGGSIAPPLMRMLRYQMDSPPPWFWTPTKPCVRSRAGSVLVKSFTSVPLRNTLMFWPWTWISYAFHWPTGFSAAATAAASAPLKV